MIRKSTPPKASRTQSSTTRRVLTKKKEVVPGSAPKEKKTADPGKRVPVRQRRLMADNHLKRQTTKASVEKKKTLLVTSGPVPLLDSIERSDDGLPVGALSADRALPHTTARTAQIEKPELVPIAEPAERKAPRNKLSRWASTNKVLRSFSGKKRDDAAPGKTEKSTRQKSAQPATTLFAKKSGSVNMQPLAPSRMEATLPARSAKPVKPPRPLRPLQPEQVDLKVDSLFALTVYSDPAHEGVRPVLTRFLEDGAVHEVAHFQRDLAAFSPEQPPTQKQATDLYRTYIDPNAQEPLNLQDTVVAHIASLLNAEPFDAAAFYVALTRSDKGSLQHNLFESSRGQLYDFPAYYAALPIEPPGSGQPDLKRCIHWMRAIYADPRYAHLRELLTAHMSDPAVGVPEIVRFLEAIARFSQDELPTQAEARDLYDRFIEPPRTGTSMLFGDAGDALNLTYAVKQAAKNAIADNDMKGFWAIVIGQPDQMPDEDADAILPQLATGMQPHYASFLGARQAV